MFRPLPVSSSAAAAAGDDKTRVCRVAGGLAYLIMVFDTNLAAVAPTLPAALTWPLTNLRALIVVALCVCGLPTTRSNSPAQPPLAAATLKS